ncbi:hypothetical protein [Vitreoscilla stercoraria]|uniref:DUF4034 domain-containing protein n=1 Tax=Vitreoscilla stercoraria TaxID=61 RepID=A0ABY4EBM3_VITST|nr:hypothetical protein [Vitreoscilla stercoraria]UOO93142.1 hypothetical protein LVJ81_03670 [Vitreoscilla stercoraria]
MAILRLLGMCALFGLTACQPSNSASNTATIKTPNTQSARPVALPAHCENIPLQMSAITNRSEVQSLAVVNQALKKCVAEVDNATRHQWLEDSYAMYQRFLDLQLTPKTEGLWDEFSWTLEGHPEETADERQARLQQQKDIWPKLNDRMKQMSQWLGQEYIDNFYIGEGMMHLRRSPQYVLDIFAPYMPEDEKVFMQQLGQENLSLTTNDAAIVLPWSELSKRALFWEQYQQRYAKSPYAKFAEYQFKWYRAALFHGTDNTPFIDRFSDTLFIAPEALQTHQTLAQHPHSSLAPTSEAALKWIAQYNAKWAKLSDHDKEKAQQAYHRSIKVDYPEPLQGSSKNQYYDCSSDAVCHLTTY